MQAIITKYHGPTNFKGSRISATCAAGRIFTGYAHELNIDGNHEKAARLLAERLGWVAPHYAPMASGCLPSGEYAHVFIPREYVAAKLAVFETRKAIIDGNTSGNPHCRSFGKKAVELCEGYGIDNPGPFAGEFAEWLAKQSINR